MNRRGGVGLAQNNDLERGQGSSWPEAYNNTNNWVGIYRIYYVRQIN